MNKQFLKNIFTSNSSISSLFLRVPVGIILTAHGAQKLFAWFGLWTRRHRSVDGKHWFNARLFNGIAGFGSAEVFGGIALIMGFPTRPAALVSAFTMVIAIFSVHAANGLFMTNNGYEFALTLLAATGALAIQGGGKLSIDSLISHKLDK